jgi:quercetin dioxygenase-like cupin family protein
VLCRVGGMDHHLREGDAVIIPPDVRHGISSVGSQPAQVVEVRRQPAQTTWM